MEKNKTPTPRGRGSDQSVGKLIPTPLEKQTEAYWPLLNNIIDPEIGIGIIDLGLVYAIEIKNNTAEVTMTFTSMGCPAGPSLIEQVKEEMEKLPNVKKTKINIVWEPAWTADRINPDIRDMLP